MKKTLNAVAEDAKQDLLAADRRAAKAAAEVTALESGAWRNCTLAEANADAAGRAVGYDHPEAAASVEAAKRARLAYDEIDKLGTKAHKESTRIIDLLEKGLQAAKDGPVTAARVIADEAIAAAEAAEACVQPAIDESTKAARGLLETDARGKRVVAIKAALDDPKHVGDLPTFGHLDLEALAAAP